MKISRVAVVVFASAALVTGQDWQIAKPGYRYEFPRDHFSHPNFQTEWWYYTGNLRATDGHRFGFELTFFRQGQRLTPEQIASSDAVWRPDQIYLAHLALSDIDGQHFFHTERLNRAGPGLAGADLTSGKYWNGNWQSKWLSLTTGEQELQAVCDKFTLTIRLNPEKPFVIHGEDGVSRKGPQPGDTSHYISYTRLGAKGELHLNHQNFVLTGLAWMDHEFFSDTSGTDLAGWDWFAIQLENNQELMLYRLRSKSGNDRFSSGTYVDAAGKAHYLDASQFDIKPAATWHSSDSGATYPISWHISVPSLALKLTQETALKGQELFEPENVTPTYWEGAVTYSGTLDAAKVHGVGYLEMTGYAKPLAAATAP
jgi:predicted secreted hydrolase